MFHRLSFCLLVLFGVNALTACATLIPAPTPTAISPEPTPTSTPIPDPHTAIVEAQKKTFEARSLRVEYRFNTDTGFGEFGGQVKTERNGRDYHSVSQTPLSSASEEVIVVGGLAYVHGPNATYGAPDAKWYFLPNGLRDSSVSSSSTPFDVFTKQLEGVVPLRSETFDNLTCDVYVRDKEATVTAFMQFSGGGQPPTADDLDMVDVAETKYWVCRDGYLHLIALNLIAHTKSAPNTKSLASLYLHFYDMGTNIEISAPEGAPAIPTPTRIPTRALIPTRTSTPSTPAIPNPQAQATAQALSADALKWRVIISDTFGSNLNGWPLDDTTAEFGPASATLAQGTYRWSASPIKDVFFWETPDKMTAQGDTYISLHARRVSAPLNQGYGLVFRESADHDDFYGFVIRDEGSFRIFVSRQKSWTTIASWTKTQAIRPGGSNRLTVVAKGAHFVFFINDQSVAEVNDNRLASGRVGVAFSSDAGESGVFEFDNLEVRAP